MKCKNCKKVIVSKHSFVFCNRSCAASFNNKRRDRKPWSTEQRKKFSKLQKQKIAESKKNGTYNRPPTRTWWPEPVLKKELKCTYCKQPFISHKGTLFTKGFPTYCSSECYLNIKKRNASGIKRCYYNGIKFDSAWEIQLAQFLDKNEIKWTIPTQSVLWTDSKGKCHQYFPDFFLPEYNIYLDPKNPLVVLKQKEKLLEVAKKINLIYGDIQQIVEGVAHLIGLEPTCLR